MCTRRRCRCLILIYTVSALVSGIVAGALGYLSLLKLHVHKRESEQWHLEEHTSSLTIASMAEIIVGGMVALVSAVGCFETVFVKKKLLYFYLILLGVTILAQLGTGIAAFVIKFRIEEDIPFHITDCEKCLVALLYVCEELVPPASGLLLVTVVTQSCLFAVYRLSQETTEPVFERSRLQSHSIKMKRVSVVCPSPPKKKRNFTSGLHYESSSILQSPPYDDSAISPRTPVAKLSYSETPEIPTLKKTKAPATLYVMPVTFVHKGAAPPPPPPPAASGEANNARLSKTAVPDYANVQF